MTRAPAPGGSPLSLALDAIFATLTAAVFAYVALLFHRRPAEGASRKARDAFTAWWASLAVLTLAGGVRSALTAVGVTDLGVHLALTHFSLVPLCIALWGLLYYLVYLHTGNEAWYWPLAVAYALLYLVFVGLVVWLDPTRVTVGEWTAGLEYTRTLSPGVGALLAVVLLGPVLVAAVLYGSLAFRVRSRIVRYRIALTSLAFILWFGSSALAGVLKLSELGWWPLASRAIGLGATLLVLLAYKPPRSWRARLEEDADGRERGESRRPLMLAPYVASMRAMRPALSRTWMFGWPRSPAMRGAMA